MLASQLARDARLFCDEAIATNVLPPLANRLRAHSIALAEFRDRLHDLCLSPEDLREGAIPRQGSVGRSDDS